MALTKEEIKKFKTSLEEKEKELTAGISKLETLPEMGADIDHFEEEADEAEEFTTNIGIAKAYREQLDRVKKALDKINNSKKGHEFGVCENCGKSIAVNLLNIDPETKCCKDCKTNCHDQKNCCE